METYQDWLKEHQVVGGGYDKLAKAMRDNIDRGGFLKKFNTFFEIGKEKKIG